MVTGPLQELLLSQPGLYFNDFQSTQQSLRSAAKCSKSNAIISSIRAGITNFEECFGVVF